VNPPNVPALTVDELPADAVILDVREPHEWHAGHIDGAIHVPMNSVPVTLTYEPETIPTEGRLFVICGVGGRSAQVTAWLVNHGVDAVNVTGGMHAWADAGRPMISDSGGPPTVLGIAGGGGGEPRVV